MRCCWHARGVVPQSVRKDVALYLAGCGEHHPQTLRRWSEARPVRLVRLELLTVLDINGLHPALRLCPRREHIEVTTAVKQDDGAGRT